jgi:hypothetical protein
MILMPVIVGLLINVLFGLSEELDTVDEFQISQIPLNAIDQYLLGTKITIIVLLAFFLCYRWSNMQNDGSYGFWLTLGVNRRKFYSRTLTKFILLLYIGQVVGLHMIFYLNQFVLDFDLMVKLLLLMLINITFIVSLAVFFGNLIQTPEFSALIYLILMGVDFGLNTAEGSFLYIIFQPDLQYRTEDAWFAILGSIPIILFTVLYSLRKHLSYDIEI